MRRGQDRRSRSPADRDRVGLAATGPKGPIDQPGDLRLYLWSRRQANDGGMTTDHLGTTVLSTDACFDLLRGQTIGRLAVSIRDHPDIFPINYVVDRGGIVFRTAEGTKLAASVLGRGVAFEVDGLDDDAGEAWSVIMKGHAVEIDGMYELLDALDLPLFPWHAGPKHRFVRIEPVEITGRRFHVVEPAVWTDPVRTV